MLIYRVLQKRLGSWPLLVQNISQGTLATHIRCGGICNQETDGDIRLIAFFPGQPGLAGTRKVKPFWVLMQQEMMGWLLHQLGHMQIIAPRCHASISSLNFVRAVCSSWCPANSVNLSQHWRHYQSIDVSTNLLPSLKRVLKICQHLTALGSFFSSHWPVVQFLSHAVQPQIMHGCECQLLSAVIELL